MELIEIKLRIEFVAGIGIVIVVLVELGLLPLVLYSFGY